MDMLLGLDMLKRHQVRFKVATTWLYSVDVWSNLPCFLVRHWLATQLLNHSVRRTHRRRSWAKQTCPTMRVSTNNSHLPSESQDSELQEAIRQSASGWPERQCSVMITSVLYFYSFVFSQKRQLRQVDLLPSKRSYEKHFLATRHSCVRTRPKKS